MTLGNCLILQDFKSEPFFGWLEVEDGKIKKVVEGRHEDVDQPLEGKLVIPALYNTHTHAAMCLLRGVAEDVPFEEWLFGRILPLEERLTEEMVYYGTILAQMEMARNGVVGFADMYFHEDAVARAVADFGLRALLTRGLVDVGGDDGGRLKENLKLYEKWNGYDGRIFVGLGPHSPYSCSRGYLKRIFDVAKEYDIPVVIHLYETARERYDLEELLRLGLGEVKVIAAHCVHVPTEKLPLLSKLNFYVSHNPTSNLKLGNGVAPVREMLRKGVKVTLGTDGPASNNTLNIFHEMRLASLLQKMEDPSALDVETCLKMATVDGAEALGFEGGAIREGFEADLVVLDLKKPSFFPFRHVKRHLVHAFSGEVFATMVKGRWVYFNGEYPTIDEGEVYKKLAEIEEKLYS